MPSPAENTVSQPWQGPEGQTLTRLPELVFAWHVITFLNSVPRLIPVPAWSPSRSNRKGKYGIVTSTACEARIQAYIIPYGEAANLPLRYGFPEGDCGIWSRREAPLPRC